MNPNLNSNPAERMQEMLHKLKQHDFRITPQRLAILKILAASEQHPSVEQIFEEVKIDFPTTSLATVYKTVALLKRLNQVLELGFPDGSNRYDGKKPFDHPHIMCIKCKKILDPELFSLDTLKAELGKKTGFKIQHHRLYFFGICPSCQQE
jgi:Fur family transcriptional regulator, peroxide stress response regulator